MFKNFWLLYSWSFQLWKFSKDVDKKVGLRESAFLNFFSKLNSGFFFPSLINTGIQREYNEKYRYLSKQQNFIILKHFKFSIPVWSNLYCMGSSFIDDFVYIPYNILWFILIPLYRDIFVPRVNLWDPRANKLEIPSLSYLCMHDLQNYWKENWWTWYNSCCDFMSNSWQNCKIMLQLFV